MTGCVTGGIVGLAIATALGWSTLGQIGLAVGLAYLFGFALTSVPLARAGLTLGAIVPIALATDTVSITIMELIANATMLLVPGAMSDRVFDDAMWGTMAVGFAIAFPFAYLANRWLLARGKGHSLVREICARGESARVLAVQTPGTGEVLLSGVQRRRRAAQGQAGGISQRAQFGSVCAPTWHGLRGPV